MAAGRERALRGCRPRDDGECDGPGGRSGDDERAVDDVVDVEDEARTQVDEREAESSRRLE